MTTPELKHTDSDTWTINTLKEHMDALRRDDKDAVQAALAAAKEAVSAALASAEKATTLAEQSAKEWRMASNEWRGAMDDRDRIAAAALEKFASKLELKAAIDPIAVQIDELKRWKDKVQGSELGVQTHQADNRSLQTMLVTIVGVVIAAIGEGVLIYFALHHP